MPTNNDNCPMNEDTCSPSCPHSSNKEVREKINVVTPMSDNIEMVSLEEGPDSGYSINFIKPSTVEFNGMIITVEDIKVLENMQELRLSHNDNRVGAIDIEDKSVIISEAINNTTKERMYILELTDAIYQDTNENDYPVIRAEYKHLVGIEDSMQTKIFIRPSSKHREVLAYAMNIPNVSRADAVFRSQEYIYKLESAKDILREISKNDASYIASPQAVTSIVGLVYGGLLLETGQVLPYHNITQLEDSVVIFDNCVYAGSDRVAQKTVNGKHIDITEDEGELINEIVSIIRDKTQEEDGITTNDERYEELIPEVCEMFKMDVDNREDINIVINNDGEHIALSLAEFEYLKDQ